MENTWVCPACSTGNPDDSESCARCGRRTATSQRHPVGLRENKEPSSRSPIWGLIYLAIIVVAVLYALWFILTLPWGMMQ